MTGWIKLVKMKEMCKKPGVIQHRSSMRALGFSKQAVAKIEGSLGLLERER